jgi:outer membrane protein assembly factor BamB
MAQEHLHESTRRKPLRLWPGVAAAVLLLLVRLVLPLVVPGTGAVAMLGAAALAVAVIVWWLFFSRAPWAERVGVIALMAVAVLATSRVVHASIANGMMGMMLPFFAIPLMCLALVGSIAVGCRLPAATRRTVMAAAIVLACGAVTLVRTGGVSGEGESDLHWRWTETPEERLLARGSNQPLAPPHGPSAASSVPEAPGAPDRSHPSESADELTAAAPPDAPAAINEPTARTSDEPTARAANPAPPTLDAAWPGFRGPNRDSIVHGMRIETDWAKHPPVEVWRRLIGPGWSSFAVQGDLLYTQEQRGQDELVSCYRLSTGEPVWMHRDAVRFWESNAGAGPRATPTVHGRRVYTLGATGIANALNADTGAVIWSRNAASDTGKDIPDWGLASSPLVIDDLAIFAVAGRLVAYDAATGRPRWFGPAGGGGYSSPHLATIDGVPQILLLRGARTTSVSPADGTPLWEHSWEPAVSIVQPAVADDGGVLVTAGDAMGGMGMRRIAVRHGPSGWAVQERWTSRGLKPYFNDFVVHEGHAYGFDGSILACIDLEDGTRRWKGGRYGHGQLVLLSDQDVMLVLSEDGELALARAASDGFTELARVPVLHGKTWNHPAVAGDLLLVRNGEEMAALRLPVAGRGRARR